MQRQPDLTAGLWAEPGRQRKYEGEEITGGNNGTQDGKYGIDRR